MNACFFGQGGNVRKVALDLENKEAWLFYDAATKEYKNGRKRDAAFLYYLGQLRAKYYLESTKAGHGDRETYSALQVIIGPQINSYLNKDMNTWLAVIDSVLVWDKAHDYTFHSKTKDPAIHQEVLDGLIDLREKLVFTKASNKPLSYFDYLPGFKFSSFKGTPLEQLARAVEYENVTDMEKLLQDKTIDLDYQEPEFGHSLLMLAVANNRKVSVEKLLQAGANPNKYDKDEESNAMTIAIEYGMKDCNADMVRLLIRYKGDVNTATRIKKEEQYTGDVATDRIRSTLLMLAIQEKCLNVVRILVDAGADINRSINNKTYYTITTALRSDDLEIARYMVIEKQAIIPASCYEIKDGDKVYKLTVADILNEESYQHTSANERIKREILDYVKSKKQQ